MLVAVHNVPVTASEVGEGHGAVVVVHGQGAKLSQAAPFGKVVHVHIQGQTILQAVYHAHVHEEVHAAVTTYLLSHLTILLDDGVTIGLAQLLHVFLAHEGVGIQILQVGGAISTLHVAAFQNKALDGVLVGKTAGARQLEQTVVGLRVHHVVLNLHNLAIGGAHQRSGVVAVAEFRAGLAGLLLHELATVHRLGVHGYQRGKAVATVNVHHLSHRTQTVSGVYVTAVFLIVLKTPGKLFRVVLGVGPVGVPERVEVVNVSTLGIQHLTQNALLSHVESVQLEPVVAAVLQNHAVLAGLFRKVNELPALLEVHGAGNFNSGVLAIFQSALSHREVVVPVRSNVHQVNVIALAKFFVTSCTRVNGSGSHTSLAQVLLALLSTLGFVVAQSNNLYTRNVGKTGNSTRTTHTKAHECYAHGLHLGSFQPHHVLLSFRTHRGFHHEGALIPVSLCIRRQRLSLQPAYCKEGKERQRQYSIQFHMYNTIRIFSPLSVRFFTRKRIFP